MTPEFWAIIGVGAAIYLKLGWIARSRANQLFRLHKRLDEVHERLGDIRMEIRGASNYR